MRKMLSILALSAALPMLAQEPPAPKFAIVIPDYIMGNSVRGKKATSEFIEVRKSLDARMQAKNEELQGKAQQLKSPGLSDEGRAKLQREIQDGEIAYKRSEEDAQKDFAAAREKLSKAYAEEVGPIVVALAKEWKLQVLFNYQEGLFPYADEAWVIAFSKEVTKRYDEKFASGTGASSAPKAKAPAKK